MTKKTYDTAIADYVDFKIEVKQAGNKNRAFQNGIQVIEARYARKQKMVDDGKLSEAAGKELQDRKLKDWAALAADHLIVSWEGKYNGTKLPEFNRDNVIEFFTKEENDTLFSDLLQFSAELGNFEEVAQEADVENLKKSTAGGKDTDQSLKN